MKIIFPLFVVAGLSVGCGSEHVAPAPEPPVEEETIPMGELRAEASGTVAELRVAEGDSVQRGQLVVKLDTTAAAEELRTAQRAYAEAESSLIDIRRGYLKIKGDREAGRIEEDVYQASLAEFRAAEAKRADAANRLQVTQDRFVRHEIFARVDGMVTSLPVTAGATITSGTVVAVIQPEG